MNNYIKEFIEKISLKGLVKQSIFSTEGDVLRCKFMNEDSQLFGDVSITPNKHTSSQDIKILNLFDDEQEDFGILEPHSLFKMISLFSDDISKWDIGFELEDSIFDKSGEIVSIQFKDGKYDCNYPLANSFVLNKIPIPKKIDFPIKTDLTLEVFEEINKCNRVIDSDTFIISPSKYNDKVKIIWSDTNSVNKRSRNITYDISLDYCKEQISKENKYSSVILREIFSTNKNFDKCTLQLNNGLFNISFENNIKLLEDEKDEKGLTITSNYSIIQKR